MLGGRRNNPSKYLCEFVNTGVDNWGFIQRYWDTC